MVGKENSDDANKPTRTDELQGASTPDITIPPSVEKSLAAANSPSVNPETRQALEVAHPPKSRSRRLKLPSRLLYAQRRTLGKTAEIRGQSISDSFIHGNSIQISNNTGSVIFHADPVRDPGPTSVEAKNLERSRELFQSSVQHRDRFVGDFLSQALRQANITFTLSVLFTAVGGALVLIAGGLALFRSGSDTTTNYVALGAGIGGLVVGASGAALARRADKARKHLADQAERMHNQLLDERKFVQVGEILAGVSNPNLNDQTRIALALKLMNADPSLLSTESPEATPEDAPQ